MGIVKDASYACRSFSLAEKSCSWNSLCIAAAAIIAPKSLFVGTFLTQSPHRPKFPVARRGFDAPTIDINLVIRTPRCDEIFPPERKTAPHCEAVLICSKPRLKGYSESWLFSAAPRISPNDAPESEDPYCSTASFSSAISRALIDRPRRRAPLSMLVTRAST